MKIIINYQQFLFESKQTNSIFKKLKIENQVTYPKILASKIFLNQVSVLKNFITEFAYSLFNNDEYMNLPIEKVDVNLIIPTQTYLRIENLESVKNITTETNSYLFEFQNKYYVLDGHHRIAMNILNDEKTIKAYVYRFVNEGYKFLDAGSQSTVKILDIENPKLVIKKSLYDGYSDMDKIHEMMSKRPDLFCRIKKHNTDYVITNKLDIDNFIKIFDENILELNKLERDSLNIEDSKALLKEDKINISNFRNILFYNFEDLINLNKLNNSINLELINNEFLLDFYKLKIKIYYYFKNILNKKILLDLHQHNFGFIQKTQKIRCFDPIFIKR